MRSVQTVASGTLASAASVQIPLAGLQTSLDGEPANVMGFGIRITKGITSIVRPSTVAVVIRDSAEPLFDSNVAELLGQQRERGEAIVAQLGAVTAIDTVYAVWRPGYGQRVEDSGHAAGLFQGGGSISLTAPTDAGQTLTYEVTAFLDTSGGLRIAPRAITRVLASTARDIQGDFLLARLRDQSFANANTYAVRTSRREIINGLTGTSLSAMHESSLGPAGDPVVMTAVAQTTLVTPNFIRSILSDYSYGGGEKQPPISKLPTSDGSVTLTSGFSGAPLVTYLYPRSKGEAEALARQACSRHGIAYRAPVPPGGDPSLYPFLPLRLVG